MKRFRPATMLTSLCAALFLLLSGLFAAEPNPMNGRWEITEMTFDGIVIPVAGMPNPPWYDMKNDVWMFWLTHMGKPGHPSAAKFQVAIDKSKSPWEVDATLARGTKKGQVCKGICEFDGQTIRLCMTDSPGTPRPTKFESVSGSSLHYLVMKRADPLVASR